MFPARRIRRLVRAVTTEVLAATALAVWLYLLFARGAFWRCTERDDWAPAKLAEPPCVAVVVPARNEADQIGASIGSLIKQDYAGPWTIILVDDESSDGTVDIARGQLGNEKKKRAGRHGRVE